MLLELIHEAALGDGVIHVICPTGCRAERITRLRRAVIGIVVVYAEGIAAEHGDVVGLTRMDLGIELRRETVLLGETVDVRCDRLVADDLRVALILLDDQKNMLVTRYGRAHCVCGDGSPCPRRPTRDHRYRSHARGRFHAASQRFTRTPASRVMS